MEKYLEIPVIVSHTFPHLLGLSDTRVENVEAVEGVRYLGLFSPFLAGHFFGKFGLTPFRRSGGTFFIPASAREGPHFGG